MSAADWWTIRYERREYGGPGSCFVGIGCCAGIALVLVLVPVLLAVLR